MNKKTQRHPLHTKISFNVSTRTLISVLMVIWGQRSVVISAVRKKLGLNLVNSHWWLFTACLIKFWCLLTDFTVNQTATQQWNIPTVKYRAGPAEVDRASGRDASWEPPFEGFPYHGLDPVIYHVWPGNASGSPRRNWEVWRERRMPENLQSLLPPWPELTQWWMI